MPRNEGNFNHLQ
jgi:hypothetical protein